MSDPSQDPTQFPSTIAWQPQAKGELIELRQLAQYRILRQLGRGGMGVVYKAEDTQLRRLAALKVMRPDYAADPEARARFLREARAAAALKHEHIVTIYQVGEEKGVPFLAMEFLSGKSLDEWLRPNRIATVQEAIILGKQIARGLLAAHKAGLVHRDIKPANLWLEAPKGKLKILDFGLARISSGNVSELTQDGSVLGTPAFMAPEQARGEVVDHRCDLFSFGCVMYRLLTGQLPFQGQTTYAILTAIASHAPLSPARVRPGIPQRLSDLVDRLLAKDPAGRPASAQVVLDELAALDEELKHPVSPPSLLSSFAPAQAVLPPSSVTMPAPTMETASLATGPTLSVRPARRTKKRKPWPLAYLALGTAAAILALAGIVAVALQNNASPEPEIPVDSGAGGSRPKANALSRETTPVTPREMPLATSPSAAASPLLQADGFVPLFDGKTLAGWNGDAVDFGVEAGSLVSYGHGTRYLYTDREYANFELRFEFKLSAGSNCGIGLRTPQVTPPDLVAMEVQMLDDTSPTFASVAPWQRHGSLYGVAAAKTGHLKPIGQWNEQSIVCDWRELRVDLNGTEVLRVNLDAALASPGDGRAHPGLRNMTGFIALCGQKERVEFRKLRIKELDDGSPSPVAQPADASAARPPEVVPADAIAVAEDAADTRDVASVALQSPGPATTASKRNEVPSFEEVRRAANDAAALIERLMTKEVAEGGRAGFFRNSMEPALSGTLTAAQSAALRIVNQKGDLDFKQLKLLYDRMGWAVAYLDAYYERNKGNTTTGFNAAKYMREELTKATERTKLAEKLYNAEIRPTRSQVPK